MMNFKCSVPLKHRFAIQNLEFIIQNNKKWHES